MLNWYSSFIINEFYFSVASLKEKCSHWYIDGTFINVTIVIQFNFLDLISLFNFWQFQKITKTTKTLCIFVDVYFHQNNDGTNWLIIFPTLHRRKYHQMNNVSTPQITSENFFFLVNEVHIYIYYTHILINDCLTAMM